MFQKSVGGKDRVVRFDDGGRNLGRWRNGKGKLGLAAIIDAQTFKKERTKTGTSTSTSGVENEETLKAGTVICKLADAVQDGIDKFFTDSVVTTGIVIGSILQYIDELLKKENKR